MLDWRIEMCKKRRERKRSKKKAKIMREAVFSLMEDTLKSILNKESTDKSLKDENGDINYYLLTVKMKTEAAMALDYIERLRAKNPLKEMLSKK